MPRGKERRDLEGTAFDHVKVGQFAGMNKWGKSTFICVCVCGKEWICRSNDLLSGRITSCGCKRVERAASLNRTHGKSSSPEYRSWQHLKERCLTPSNKDFAYYGGRGIQVCKEWADSFDQFLTDMGPRPSLEYSIDRINNDGNYEKSNCRWATKSEQMLNRRKWTYA